MVATRRRGKELEQAIFAAVLAELAETGYTGLTIEGVAARAQTSRPVLYRRWSTRAELVLAALVDSHPHGEDVPDTGSLRSDVIALLKRAARRYSAIGQEAISGLLAETARDPKLAGLVRAELVQSLREEMMTTVLDRAVERQEIASDRPHQRVITLPLDLLSHDLFTYGSTTASAIADIVDQTFLPLLRRGGH